MNDICEIFHRYLDGEIVKRFRKTEIKKYGQELQDDKFKKYSKQLQDEFKISEQDADALVRERAESVLEVQSTAEEI